MPNAKDANCEDAGFGRRTFLQQMATAAGAAPLASALIGGGAVSIDADTALAQTAPAHHEQTNHETERLAAYAAKLGYDELRCRAALEQDDHRPCAAHQRRRQEQHSGQ
jgi:hypothetical protein